MGILSMMIVLAMTLAPRQVQVQKGGDNPIYKITINVVEREATAINYQHRSGSIRRWPGTARVGAVYLRRQLRQLEGAAWRERVAGDRPHDVPATHGLFLGLADGLDADVWWHPARARAVHYRAVAPRLGRCRW